MAGNQLYVLFCSLCPNASLLQHIVDRLSTADVRALRLSNKVLRQAVAPAVKRVVCSARGPRLENDLTEVFPAACSVRVTFQCPPGGTLSELDGLIFLQHVASTQQQLLEHADAISIDTSGVPAAADLHVTILRLLSLCISAHQANVSWSYPDRPHLGGQVVFLGQGSTSEQRRSSMQQQLATICTSPAFLAPASWPAHGCLTSLIWRAGADPNALSSGLRAAFGTTSLASLALYCSAPNDLEGCSALTALRSLTYLNVRAIGGAIGPASQAARQELAATAAGLTPLVELVLDGLVLPHADVPGMPGTTVIPQAWSKLTNLTSLGFSGCLFKLDALPTLPALRYLTMEDCTTTGSLWQLSALTALTRLVDGVALVDDIEGGAADEGPPGRNLLGPRVPQQWQQGLQQLEWSFRRADMPLLAHLHALTSLQLNSALLCPSLCCHLALIPNLKQLRLVGESVRHGYWPSDRAYRPALRSLQQLDIAGASHLQHFASWTDVPSDLKVALKNVQVGDGNYNPIGGYGWVLHLEYTYWGAGWLPALLGSIRGGRAKGAQLLLRDDTAAARLVQALQAAGRAGLAPASVEGPDVALVLGSSMTAQGFRQLFTAGQHLPGSHLHITSKPREFRWMVQVPRSFFSGLPGAIAPGLRQLTLDSAEAMQDIDVASIVSAAPALEAVVLGDPSQLTDCSLYALVGCRKLSCIKLMGPSKVTARGVAMLLTNTTQLLAELSVAGVEPADVLRQLQQVEWQRPVAAVHTWTMVAPVGASMTQCLLKPVV